MGKFLSKLKNFIKTFFGILAIIALAAIVLTDLGREGGGYIEWVIISIVFGVLACYEDAQEIMHTPLASLTIGKIFVLAFYFYATWLLWVIGKAIWEEVSEYLDERSRKCFEIERERERKRVEEEAKYSEESQQKCAECVAAMETTESPSDLESLFEEAISNWPRWKKSLSKVFKARKHWIKKNILTDE